MSAGPDHTRLDPPASSTARLHGRIPTDGARRALWLLAIGHLCIAVATVPIILLVTRVPGTPAASRSIGPSAGALFLVAAQVLSCWRASTLARAATDHIHVTDITRSLRRSEWSFVLTLLPAGVQWVLLSAESPAPQLSLLFALLAAALLLESGGIDWHHRRTMRLGQDQAGVAHRLPTGTGPRTRTVHGRVAGIHAAVSGVAAVLLVTTVVAVAGDATATPLAASAQIAAAMAATAVPLLPIRGILRVRAAIAGDTVHDPALDRAMASSRRACVAGVLLTAVAIASLWAAPVHADLAAGLCVLAVVAAGIAVSHVIELERFRLGDIPGRFRPKG